MKAKIWRALMGIGMRLHRFASPKPPDPAFTVKVPSRISKTGGHFKLYFYLPEGYLTAPEDHLWPVVINYHGGGFTLGTGTDDARWAAAVTQHAHAIVVSVAYRLAPKYPFSIGVEDGTDAVIYIAAHAEELRIDPHRIALSGFSAGGNFALTVPLMLYDLQHDAGKRELCSSPRPTPAGSRNPSRESLHDRNTDNTAGKSTSQASNSHDQNLNTISHINLKLSSSSSSSSNNKSTSTLDLPQKPLQPTVLELSQTIPPLTLRALVSFYPPTDFRISRDEKRKTNSKPEHNLPPILSNLFDESYLNPSRSSEQPFSLADPYLTPMAATSSHLANAYPDPVVLYTCEYDMLNAEGIAFSNRLKADPIRKTVKGGVILGVPHGFDRKPNPLRFPKEAERAYLDACAELRSVFWPDDNLPSFLVQQEEDDEDGVARMDGDDDDNNNKDGDEDGDEADGGEDDDRGRERGQHENESAHHLDDVLPMERFDDPDPIPVPAPNELVPPPPRKKSLGDALRPAKVVQDAI